MRKTVSPGNFEVHINLFHKTLFCLLLTVFLVVHIAFLVFFQFKKTLFNICTHFWTLFLTCGHVLLSNLAQHSLHYIFQGLNIQMLSFFLSLKRILTPMYFLMALQITDMTKAFSACIARIRFFASVNPFMNC